MSTGPEESTSSFAWQPLLAVVMVLIIIAGVLLAHELFPARVAQVVSVMGNVQIQKRASSDWKMAEVGQDISVGGSIKADDGASATLHFGHPSTFRSESAGLWTVDAVRRSRNGAYGRAVIHQYAGQASYVCPLPQDNLDILVQIEVEGGTITLRGAATLTTIGDSTAVHLLAGSAIVLTPTEYVVIPEGDTAVVAPDRAIIWDTATPSAD